MVFFFETFPNILTNTRSSVLYQSFTCQKARLLCERGVEVSSLRVEVSSLSTSTSLKVGREGRYP